MGSVIILFVFYSLVLYYICLCYADELCSGIANGRVHIF